MTETEEKQPAPRTPLRRAEHSYAVVYAAQVFNYDAVAYEEAELVWLEDRYTKLEGVREFFNRWWMSWRADKDGVEFSDVASEDDLSEEAIESRLERVCPYTGDLLDSDSNNQMYPWGGDDEGAPPYGCEPRRIVAVAIVTKELDEEELAAVQSGA